MRIREIPGLKALPRYEMKLSEVNGKAFALHALISNIELFTRLIKIKY